MSSFCPYCGYRNKTETEAKTMALMFRVLFVVVLVGLSLNIPFIWCLLAACFVSFFLGSETWRCPSCLRGYLASDVILDEKIKTQQSMEAGSIAKKTESMTIFDSKRLMRFKLADVYELSSACQCTLSEMIPRLQTLISLLKDSLFLAHLGEELPHTSRLVIGEYKKQSDIIFKLTPFALDHIAASVLNHCIAKGVQTESSIFGKKDCSLQCSASELNDKFRSAVNIEEKEQVLDLLSCALFARSETFIKEAVSGTWAEEGLSVLTLASADKNSRIGFSKDSLTTEKIGLKQLEELMHRESGILEFIWYSKQNKPEAKVLELLNSWVNETLLRPTRRDFLERWANKIPLSEANILRRSLYGEQPLVPSAPASQYINETQSTKTELKATSKPTYLQTQPKSDLTSRPSKSNALHDESKIKQKQSEVLSLWNEHIQPFVSENWYMVAGIAMVIIGSSLLAYYTWDKHWLLRYTIMPLLFGCFTASLSSLGTWIEKQDKRFFPTASMLRAAAILLLPMNFMTVALLAGDTDVSSKSLFVPLMGGVYLLVFGYYLPKWCEAVHKPLGFLLGTTLLGLNFLVMLASISANLFSSSQSYSVSEQLLFFVGVGFYLGFFVAANSVIKFVNSVLSLELVQNKTVSWFFGTTLLGTFIQIFIWVHSAIRTFPEIYTYAPMVILCGCLLLLVERRVLELRGEQNKHIEESFIGYALLLLGLIMGMSSEWVRILCFLLCATTWLYQAMRRENELHYWISLTFSALGFASFGLIEAFPKERLPELGLVIALLYGAFASIAGSYSYALLRSSCMGMQVMVLGISSAVAVLVQWHFKENIPALRTGVQLLLIAAIFAWRASKEQKLRWLHACMVLLAMSLPYLGCVDMSGRTLHGNTMVFGLSILSFLWLTLVWLSSSTILRQARSTVLFIYGGLALTAMILRVVFEGHVLVDIHSWQPMFDFAGPIMITIALGFASYYSSSLIPASMAVGIVIILFPELKLAFRRTNFVVIDEILLTRSGLGSVSSALFLLGLSFKLRVSEWINKPRDADLFWGKFPFPCRRNDHTLLTLPILASVVFLLLRVDVFLFFVSFVSKGVQFKTSIAMLMSSIVWTLLAVYLRKKETSSLVCANFACLVLFAGFSTGANKLGMPQHWTSPFLVTAVVIQMACFFYNLFLEGRYVWVSSVLSKPLYNVLSAFAFIFCCVCVFVLLFHSSFVQYQYLIAFLCFELIWQGVLRKNVFYSHCLFYLLLVSLLSFFSKGTDYRFLLCSLTESSITSGISFLLIVHCLLTLLEIKPSIFLRYRYLLSAHFFHASVFAYIAGVSGLALCSTNPLTLTNIQSILLFSLLFISARTNTSGLLFLLGATNVYVFLHKELVFSSNIFHLFAPYHVSLFALTLSCLAFVLRYAAIEAPNIISGSFRGRELVHRMHIWLGIPAFVLACSSALDQSLTFSFHGPYQQLLACFISAVTCFSIFYLYQSRLAFLASVVSFTLGNLNVIRYYFLDILYEHGIQSVHLLCLSLLISLLVLTAIRSICSSILYFLECEKIARLLLAGSIIFLLAANYIVHPDLSLISSERFMVSALMAYLAGLYFRYSARNSTEQDASFIRFYEGLYHFSVAMTFWCLALLIPFLRSSNTALIALSIPAIYFYLCAEIKSASSPCISESYRNSSSTLIVLLLCLYVFRDAFQAVFFPDVLIASSYYHFNSPVVILFGLILFRIHKLGETVWVAELGGIVFMLGSYFAVGLYSKLSPFSFPVAGAWTAILLSHLYWTFFNQPSFLRTSLQKFAGLDAKKWSNLTNYWAMFLVFVLHFVVAWGLLNCDYYPDLFAPLILGLSSFVLYVAYLSDLRLFKLLGEIEVLIALHTGFFIDSYLTSDNVVWVLLCLWGTLLLATSLSANRRLRSALASRSFWFSVLVFAHIIYHHPASDVGLWSFGLLAFLLAITPTYDVRTLSVWESCISRGLIFAPTWLVYFSQSPILAYGLDGAFVTLPILMTGFSILTTGALCIWYLETAVAAQKESLQDISSNDLSFIFHSTLSWLKQDGLFIYTASLWCASIVTFMVQITHYDRAYTGDELVAILLLYAALSIFWYINGRSKSSILAYYFIQLCILGFFSVLRRQAMLLYPGFWSYEFDVWASLLVTVSLAGAKSFWDVKTPEVRVPLLTTLLAMPVVALIWVMIHHLGTDAAILVVGLHSFIFAFLGKDEKESPYNVVSVFGFVTFVILVFWSKLHLHFVHVYVIPVSIGVLTLLQMFKEQIDIETRNNVRIVALFSMLGSSGYYALINSAYPLSFNLGFAALCIFCMGLGSFFRVKLYLSLGFTGLMFDLSSMLFKTIRLMERSSRMTVIGSLVLLMGATLLFSAVYYKTNQEKINAKLDALRKYFGAWE